MITKTAVFVFFLSTTVTDGFTLPTPSSTTTSKTTSSFTSLNVVGQQAESFGPASVLRSLKRNLPQIDWLAQGDGSPENKENIPQYVQQVLAQPSAPKRQAENDERTQRIRSRYEEAASDAKALKGMCVGELDTVAWWRTPHASRGNNRRLITKDDPLRVLIAGGGLAGLVAAAACHAKGMKVSIFEQASSYAPYGGPIQIQSNALRAIQQISPRCFEELCAAGTVTADRVSGLKIGYRKGNKLAGLYDAGDWLVRFDTIGPALEAGLPATVVVDRPVIQQIFVKHGIPEGAVRIGSRIQSYETQDDGSIVATLEDGTQAYGDVLIGADGIWSQIRKLVHGLDEGAGGFAASGAAGGALDDKEARKLAKDTVRIAQKAARRYSGFTCYAALASHQASNIEDVSYQILLGEKKYFVSTDGGGERQQWFALIREPAGGVDLEPTEDDPHPKLTRLRQEFAAAAGGDNDGNEWDPFALELINASSEEDIKRRDLYDGAPLLATMDPQRLLSPWAKGSVALCGDAAHPMMPNLGQGGCQATEDGFRLAEELAKVRHTDDISRALGHYSRVRVIRTSIIQGFAQLGSDLLVDFDLMMTIPILGPFFLKMTQLSMPWVLRFLYTAKF